MVEKIKNSLLEDKFNIALIINEGKSENLEKFLNKYFSAYMIFEVEWEHPEDNNKRLINLFFSVGQVKNLQSKIVSIILLNVKEDKKDIYFQNEIITIQKEIFLIYKNLNTSFLMTRTTSELQTIISLLELNKYNLTNQSKSNFLIKGNLQGYSGWNKLSTMFETLNKCVNWLVIRNFENLSDDFEFCDGDDIDILCENQKTFINLINAKKRIGGRCSYIISVNDFDIPLDIRFVGDKYFDPLWQRDMLNNKRFIGSIPVPSEKDYFYSLIYHAKLQKYQVKNEYVNRLNDLSQKIGLSSATKNFIYDDKYTSSLINNFLELNGYKYTYTDNARRNHSFLKTIKFKEINDLKSNWRSLSKIYFKLIFNKLYSKFFN
jgi:hypothetical protein